MTIQELQEMVAKFRDDRDWGKYHTIQNLCLAIASEVGELCHEARWGSLDIEKLRLEMADIAIFLMYLADVTGINLESAIIDKIAKNSIKYPIGQ